MTACSWADSTLDSTPGPAPDAELSAVGIEATGCGLQPAIGSGAVVAEPGLVVTVAHAVAGSDQITVIDHAGVRHDAELRLLDPASDVAVLQVDALQAEPLSLGSTTAPVDGHLLARGRRDNVAEVPVTLTRRIVVTIEDIYTEVEVERTAFELDGKVEPGDSGGVVVVDGVAVAMVYAKARNVDGVGFALDEKELADAIEAAGNATPGPIDSGRCVR